MTARSQKKRDPGWLGPVVQYEVDGVKLSPPENGKDLYLEQQGIKHCQILFRWSNVITIFVSHVFLSPNRYIPPLTCILVKQTPSGIRDVIPDEYNLGIVYQAANTGMYIESIDDSSLPLNMAYLPGSDIHSYCFTLQGRDLSGAERDRIVKLFLQIEHDKSNGLVQHNITFR